MNGQPVTANDLIMGINPDSPFMPPLDGSPAPILQQFENQYPANPTATPQPVPVIPPKPAAPSFGEQITNLMRTGQEWLFRSVLDTIIRPLMPILTFLAWIIASFVLELFTLAWSPAKEATVPSVAKRTTRSRVLVSLTP